MIRQSDFCPPMQLHKISDEFIKRSTMEYQSETFQIVLEIISIKLINLKQKLSVIFPKIPLTDNISLIKKNNEPYFFYSSPIKIEPYCIQCHGKKEEVIPYTSQRNGITPHIITRQETFEDSQALRFLISPLLMKLFLYFGKLF